jgi:hypothetical protein
MEKKISKRFWFSYGRTYGFAIGFDLDKYHVTFNLLFWYIGLEY